MPAAAPVVRRATAADAEPLAELLIAMGWFRWMAEAGPEDVVNRVRRHLALCLGEDGDSPRAHSVYVAEPAGALRGYLSAHWLPYLIRPGVEGFVSELFIHPAERGRGLGTALLQALVEEAKGRGCDRLSLLNSRERESYERGFYSRHGWVERPDMANFILPL